MFNFFNFQWKVNIEKQTLPTIIGEWSLAITDCQKYLHNGYDVPYVPPDAGKDPKICQFYNSEFTSFSEDYKNFLRNYMRFQMEAYETGLGWFFWTAKTENHSAPEWDYLFLLKSGIAPQNLIETPKFCTHKKHLL